MRQQIDDYVPTLKDKVLFALAVLIMLGTLVMEAVWPEPEIVRVGGRNVGVESVR